MCVNISAITDPELPGRSYVDYAIPEDLITTTIPQDYYHLVLTTAPSLFGETRRYSGDEAFYVDFSLYTELFGSDITDNFFIIKDLTSDTAYDYSFTLVVTSSKTYEITHEIYQQLISEFTTAHGVEATFKLLTDYTDTSNNRHYIEFTCEDTKDSELFNSMWSQSLHPERIYADYPYTHTFSEELISRIYSLDMDINYTTTKSYYSIRLKDNIDTDSEAEALAQQVSQFDGIEDVHYAHIITEKQVEYTPLQLEIIKKSPMAVSFMPDSWYLDRVLPRYNWSPGIYVEFEEGYGTHYGDQMKNYDDLNLDWDQMSREIAYSLYDPEINDWVQTGMLLFRTFDDAYNALATFADVNDRGDYWFVDNAFKVIEGNKYRITNAYFNDFDDKGCYVDEDVIKEYLTPEEIAENLDEINAYLESMGLEEMTVPSFEGNANKNLSPLQIELIRKAHENPSNYFMPDSWFVDKTQYSFSDTLLIYFIDGYELNLEDFSDINYKELKPAPEYDEEYKENSFAMTFNSFDDLYNSYDALSEISVIDTVYGGLSYPEPYYQPHLGDIAKYLTAEEIQENAELICEILHLTQAYLFEFCGIAVLSTLPGDIDCNGKVQLNDIVILSKAVSAEDIDDVLDSQGKANADVFADGIIDSADLSVFASAMVNSELSAMPIIPNNE
jgi:hypothetical protein